MVDDEDPGPHPLKNTREYEVPASLTTRPLVLVVDDDADIREVIEELLADSGFEAVTVSDGELALRYLREHPATSVVLMDLMMPFMNGWTLAERLQSTPQLAHIPVVVMTAAGPHWGYPAGHVLRKPISRNELLAALQAALAHGRATQAAG